MKKIVANVMVCMCGFKFQSGTTAVCGNGKLYCVNLTACAVVELYLKALWLLKLCSTRQPETHTYNSIWVSELPSWAT